MQRIQKADPRARRAAVRLVTIAAVIGLGAILLIEYFREDLELALERNIDYLATSPAVVALGALVIISPVLAAAVYLLIFGKRTVGAEQYPPPGYALTRDTVVVSGPRAVRRGRIIQALSVLLMGVGMLMPVFVYYVILSLGKAV